MELEYKTLATFVGPDQQAELDALAADGWQVMQGTRPIAVYSLVRIKMSEEQREAQKAQQMGAIGTLKIDETKIHHIRGGRVVRPDGTVADEEESKRILAGNGGEAKPAW